MNMGLFHLERMKCQVPRKPWWGHDAAKQSNVRRKDRHVVRFTASHGRCVKAIHCTDPCIAAWPCPSPDRRRLSCSALLTIGRWRPIRISLSRQLSMWPARSRLSNPLCASRWCSSVAASQKVPSGVVSRGEGSSWVRDHGGY